MCVCCYYLQNSCRRARSASEPQMFADALMADRAMHGNNKNNNNKNQKQHTKNKNNNKNSNHKHATKKLAVRVEHALQQQEKKSNYNKPW